MRQGLHLFLFTILAVSSSGASVFHVTPNGGGDTPTIQTAVDASAFGDTILLGDGIFTGPGNRELVIPRPRTLASVSGDPQACIIDAEGHALGTLGEDPAANEHFYFEGISFRNGLGLEAYWDKKLHLTRCRFESCEGVLYGPSYVIPSGLVDMDDCDIVACTPSTVAYSGTLILSNSVVIRNSRFIGNTGSMTHGVQLVYGDHASFEACIFQSNVNGGVNASLIGSSGGASHWGEGFFRDCSFSENQSGYCVLVAFEDARFERCRFENNLSHCLDMFGDYNLHNHLVEVSDCVFRDNAGSGIIRQDIDLDLTGCSFVHGGGAADIVDWSGYVQPPLNIDRCIFAFRFAGSVLLEQDFPLALQISCTDVYGIAGGDWTGPLAPFDGLNNNFSADPLFCDWSSGDLTLYDISPCLPDNNDCGVLIGAEGEGCSDPSSVPEESAATARFEQNHPNPFNPATRIVFSLTEVGLVTLGIHDATGRRVVTLLDGDYRAAGRHAIDWRGKDDTGVDLASGVYFARLATDGPGDELKMILLR